MDNINGKLIKRSDGRYDLYLLDDINMLHTFASTQKDAQRKLSLKNCQVIESGYDLDYLAHDVNYGRQNFGNVLYDIRNAFKQGFQKALEILGDKKYTEDNMMEMAGYMSGIHKIPNTDGSEEAKKYLKTFEVKEWDVEIEMETPAATYGHSGWHDQTKLDSDVCLILKRK